MRIRSRFLLAGAVCLASLAANAQNAASPKAPAQDPATYMHVDAPFAQQIVLRVKAQHHDIVKLGLHAVPPGATDNVIIANITSSKIGKKSSPADLQKLAQNRPIAVPLDKSRTFDLLLPITDSHGGDLDGGFVVMEVPYADAANQEEALKIGIRVRDQVRNLIPSRTALYQP